jgi:hypothetical protein
MRATLWFVDGDSYTLPRNGVALWFCLNTREVFFVEFHS